MDSVVGGDPMEVNWVSSNDSGNRFKNQSEFIRYLIQGIPFALVSISLIWLLENLLLSIFFTDLASLFSVMFVLAIVLVVMLGALNSFFAAALWDIKPKQTCTSFAGQGLLLVFMAYIFNPFFLIFLITFSMTVLYDLVVYVAVFLFLAFIGGYLGKNIAMEFEGENENTVVLASVHDRHVACPHCGEPTVIGPRGVDEQRGTHCSACKRWFGVFDRGPVLE